MSADSPEPPSALKPARNPTTKIIRKKIWRRMHVENEHFMGAFVGREGFAKSHTALKVASVLDPSFNADRVFFDPQQFLEAFDDDDTGKGNIIVFDEAGVGLGNRSWYEKEQILTNQVLQTVRDENMGVLFTLPRLEELDNQTTCCNHPMYSDTNPAGSIVVGGWAQILADRHFRAFQFASALSARTPRSAEFSRAVCPLATTATLRSERLPAIPGCVASVILPRHLLDRARPVFARSQPVARVTHWDSGLRNARALPTRAQCFEPRDRRSGLIQGRVCQTDYRATVATTATLRSDRPPDGVHARLLLRDLIYGALGEGHSSGSSCRHRLARVARTM